MKNLKKILAVILAMILMAALSVAIFADAIGENGTVGAKNAELTAPTTVTFKNVLKAYNPDETSIYAPAVSYAFAIAPATTADDGVGITVTDTDGVLANVKAGVGAPTITNAAWTMDNTLTAAADGAENNKDITVSFANVTFTAAGVYRYKITRTVTDTNSALTTTDNNNRYLDVYVKEVNGERVIYGYVLHNVTDDITTSTTKSVGFLDEYKTSNLVVSKTLVNDSANNSHEFPFSVTLNGTKNANIKVTTSGTATATTPAAPTIANGGSVKYIGIPNGFTASVYETNDVTGTTYKSEGAADTAAAAKNITWADGSNQSNTASSAAAENATKTIAFTNTLELISPTGVILRIAPFAIILLAGVVLFVVARRRRVED